MAVACAAESSLRSNLLLFRRTIVTVIAAVNIPGHPCAHRRGYGEDSFISYKARELIKVYGKGEGAVKAFCSNCGSSLFGGEWPDGDQVSIRMGAFDDDPGIRPQFHTFVECRAPWDTITDDLPQYAERRT